jgi:hypothetical protein
LSREELIRFLSLVFERPPNPLLVRSVPPRGGGARRNTDFVEIVDRQVPHPLAEHIQRRRLTAGTRSEDEKEHGTVAARRALN